MNIVIGATVAGVAIVSLSVAVVVCVNCDTLSLGGAPHCIILVSFIRLMRVDGSIDQVYIVVVVFFLHTATVHTYIFSFAVVVNVVVVVIVVVVVVPANTGVHGVVFNVFYCSHVLRFHRCSF